MNDAPGIKQEPEIWLAGTRFLTQTVERALSPILPAAPYTSDLEEAVTFTIQRMMAWMRSLSKLDSPGDVQAVCTACRSLFDLRLDMELFKRNSDLVRKWKAHLPIRRCKAAKVLVDLLKTYSHLAADPAVLAASAYLNDPKIVEAVAAAQARYYGEGKTPGHWSSVRSPYFLADHLEGEFPRIYRTLNYNANNYISPGYGGPLFFDKKQTAQLYDYMHMHAQRFFAEATIITIDLLSIAKDGEDIKRAIELARLSASGEVPAWKQAIHSYFKCVANEHSSK